MESDNENSPTSSSISSLPRKRIEVQDASARMTRYQLSANDDFDMDSDSTDNLIRSYTHSKNSDRQSRTFSSKEHLNSINHMPPEILLLIFSHVSHKPDLVPLLLVCKSWANLIVELIWFRPSLMDQRSLEKLSEVMKLDRAFTFRDYRQFIRRLNLSFMYDKVDDSFLDLFSGCTNLERLTLVNCTSLTHQPIARVLQGCEKLQSIDLTGVTDITDEIFIALAENCPRVQGLYSPGCVKISNGVLLKLVDNCPMLKRVKISECPEFNDESLIEMTNKCKALIEIDVHNCPNLTDRGLQRVFTSVETLREFRVSHNSNISDAVLRTIPDGAYLERLRIIDFTGCVNITDRTVDRIVQFAPRLRNVTLSKCWNITDSSLRSLAVLGKSLHYLHLGHCNSITDFGVTTLLKNCHRLQYIDFACCTQLTNSSLVELSQLPRLRRIGLVKCSSINDAGLITLIQRRGYEDTVERVHLSYCTNIGLYSIFQLLQACPRLTHLSLTGINAFLRPDITQFCRAPPPDFTANQKSQFCVFSGQGVKHLREYFTRLFLNPNSLLPNNAIAVDNENLELTGFPILQSRINLQRLNNIFRQHPGQNEIFSLDARNEAEGTAEQFFDDATFFGTQNNRQPQETPQQEALQEADVDEVMYESD